MEHYVEQEQDQEVHLSQSVISQDPVPHLEVCHLAVDREGVRAPVGTPGERKLSWNYVTMTMTVTMNMTSP